jgi:succinyl-diaminopimelate desuccinylase
MSDETIELTRKLVRIQSSNPGIYEKEIGAFIYNWLACETKATVMKDPVEEGRFNVVAKKEGKDHSHNLVYICHMDTVPAGDGWSVEPFKAVIEGNKLYGRGALDMKSGLAAAMVSFKNVCNQLNELERDFVFIATVDEEGCIMKGAVEAVKAGRVTENSLMLDTEPSDEKIMPGHKGKTWFKIVTQGKAAHGSAPYNGVDAILAMGYIITEIKDRLEKLPADPVMGNSTVCYGTLKGGLNTNIVADRCELTIDMRLVPPFTNDESITLVEEAIKAATAKVEGASGTYEVIAKRPYIKIYDSSVLLKNLKESVQRITGEAAGVDFFTGYTDTAVIAAMTGNENCMTYGPKGGGLHEINEYVFCDSVIRVEKVLEDLAVRMLTK